MLISNNKYFYYQNLKSNCYRTQISYNFNKLRKQIEKEKKNQRIEAIKGEKHQELERKIFNIYFKLT